jgi:ribokinase
MPNQPRPLVVVGSINTDLVATAARLPASGETITGTSFRIFQGGKGANQAVAAARLGYPVTLIGKVGDDDFGRESLAHLQRQGIDTTHIAIHPGESGVAVITVSAAGDNNIVVIPGANAAVTPDFLDSQRSIIAAAGMVLTQLEIPIESVERLAEICQQENVPLMLDPAPAATLPSGLLARCIWATPNETEAAFYVPASQNPEPQLIAETLLAQGIAGVVLKLGDKGTYIATKNGTRQETPAFKVHAIDSTAAGDTFNGAFAVSLLRGLDLPASARYASAAAAISVTRPGAQASMPTANEVDQFLSQNS